MGKPRPMRRLAGGLLALAAIAGGVAHLTRPGREGRAAREHFEPRVGRPSVARTTPRAAHQGSLSRGERTSGIAVAAITDRPSTTEARLPQDVEVSGLVADATGGIVPAAVVTLQPQGEVVAVVTRTDASGAFRAHVPAGKVDVSAQADAYSSVLRSVNAPAQNVQLVLAPAADLPGRVVNKVTRTPIPGVKVIARSTNAELPVVITTVADLEGHFLVRGLRGGNAYEVSAVDARWHSESSVVDIALAIDHEPIELVVLAATSLTGALRGLAQPCTDGVVMMQGPSSSGASPRADGSVKLEGLLPGAYELRIICPQALPLYEQLEVGTTPLMREWTLDAGFALSGRVETLDGAPVPSAVVGIVPQGEPGQRAAINCTTDQRGEFSCSGLEPGKYSCGVESGDPTRQLEEVSIVDSSISGLLLRTRPSGTIRVSLLHQGSGLAASTIDVFARGPGGVPLSAQRTANELVFEHVPLGRYEVYAEVPSSGSSIVADVQRDGELVEVELPAPRLAALEGRVLDEAGSPVIDAWVSVTPSDVMARPIDSEHGAVLTGPDGSFVFAALGAGSYDLRIWNESSEVVAHDVATGAPGVVLTLR
jgi:protocatechuate 3,4-dioxygenase beta subunit